MNKYFKFNDTTEKIIKVNDIYETLAFNSNGYFLEIIYFRDNKEVIKQIKYQAEETRTKDINRLVRFLNKKEVLL